MTQAACLLLESFVQVKEEKWRQVGEMEAEYGSEVNPTVVKKEQRELLKCKYCRPNRGCNGDRRDRWMNRSWKDQTRRERQYK